MLIVKMFSTKKVDKGHPRSSRGLSELCASSPLPTAALEQIAAGPLSLSRSLGRCRHNFYWRKLVLRDRCFHLSEWAQATRHCCSTISVDQHQEDGKGSTKTKPASLRFPFKILESREGQREHITAQWPFAPPPLSLLNRNRRGYCSRTSPQAQGSSRA